MKKLMIMAVAAAASGLAAVADTSFAYQGVLRDEVGQPLDANQKKITFRLYDAATDGTTLWEKELNLAIDTNGLFNAELTGNDLAGTIAKAENEGKTIYVGLTVENSAGEITPRQKMIPTPLASYAQNVAKADKDFTVNGTAYFEKGVSMKNDAPINAAGVDVSGELDVTGKAVLKGGSELQGEVKVADSLTVRGVQMSMPIGSIIMWSGAANELPKDGCWALCDGTGTYPFNGNTNDVRKVPDLRGRFIVGVGMSGDVTYNAGETGGTNTVTLTKEQLPAHTHSLGKWDEVHADNNKDFIFVTPSYRTDSECKNETHDKGDWNGNTGSVGSDQPHENRPPYYALCYIIKIK